MAALGTGSVPGCDEHDPFVPPAHGRAETFILDLSKTCGNPGDTVRLTYYDPRADIDKLPTVNFTPGAPAAVQPSNWERPVESTTFTLDVTVPEAATSGPIELESFVKDFAGSNRFKSEPFTIPCPPDAGLDGSSDADASPSPTTEGFAYAVGFNKTGSATSGRFSKTYDDKVLVSATAGEANVTEIDPATGAVKQTYIPNVTVAAAMKRTDNSTVIVGRSGITPLAARIGSDSVTSWAFTFGGDLERAVDIAALDADNYLVPFEARILRLPASGTGAKVISFDTPSKTNTRAAAALVGGSWIVGAEVERTFPEQDLLIIAMAANDSILWQRLFANGGRQDLSGILGLSDGGALLIGGTQPPGPTVAATGWIARMASDGTVAWQRNYGTSGTIVLSSAIQTATGFRVLGSSSGGLAVMDLNGDGSVIATRRFKDTQSTASFRSMGIGQTAQNDILFGGISTITHTYQVVKANADLALGCGDATLRAPVDIASVPSALVVTVPTHVATSTATTGTPVTVTAGAPQAATPVDQCTNTR